MAERVPRLGEVIDDYCPRCRLLLNHDVASLAGAEVAKVTCRICHNTHDYRHAQAPARRASASKKKKALVAEVLAGMPSLPPAAPPPPPTPSRRRDLWADVERLRKKP